jgi:hypothetical protein
MYMKNEMNLEKINFKKGNEIRTLIIQPSSPIQEASAMKKIGKQPI